MAATELTRPWHMRVCIYPQSAHSQPEVTDQREVTLENEELHKSETISSEKTIENLTKWQKYRDNKHSLYFQRTHP